MKKVISGILLIIVVMFMLSNVVLASDPILSAMDKTQGSSNSTVLTNIGGRLYGIILVVGSAIAVALLAIMAVKFMTSGAEEKAKVKENLIGYVIGVVILLCVISILGIFQNIGGQITDIGKTGSITFVQKV